jgi:hypothetical protein
MLKVTDEQIIFVSSKFPSAAQAAKFLGMPFNTFKRRAQNLGCYNTNQSGVGISKPIKNPSYRYDLREDAFDAWTPEMAYWLGFIAADGNIASSTKNLVQVGLNSIDKYHLVRLSNFLGSTYPIHDHVVTRKGKTYLSSMLAVSSKVLKERLVSLGIEPNKSTKSIDFLSFVPTAYKVPFILGYFDGDGSISNLDKGYSVSFTGNVYFLTNLAFYFYTTFGLEYSGITKEGVARELYYTRASECAKFCTIYISFDLSLPLLTRKMNKVYFMLSDTQQ